MAGVDLRTVQELVGHKTIQMTVRDAHLAPQHRLPAIQRLCDTEAVQKTASDTRTDTGSRATVKVAVPVSAQAIVSAVLV